MRAVFSNFTLRPEGLPARARAGAAVAQGPLLHGPESVRAAALRRGGGGAGEGARAEPRAARELRRRDHAEHTQCEAAAVAVVGGGAPEAGERAAGLPQSAHGRGQAEAEGQGQVGLRWQGIGE